MKVGTGIEARSVTAVSAAARRATECVTHVPGFSVTNVPGLYPSQPSPVEGEEVRAWRHPIEAARMGAPWRALESDDPGREAHEGRHWKTLVTTPSPPVRLGTTLFCPWFWPRSIPSVSTCAPP